MFRPPSDSQIQALLQAGFVPSQTHHRSYVFAKGVTTWGQARKGGGRSRRLGCTETSRAAPAGGSARFRASRVVLTLRSTQRGGDRTGVLQQSSHAVLTAEVFNAAAGSPLSHQSAPAPHRLSCCVHRCRVFPSLTTRAPQSVSGYGGASFASCSLGLPFGLCMPGFPVSRSSSDTSV